jgi:hypothetical protein
MSGSASPGAVLSAAGPTVYAAADAEHALAGVAPHLVRGFAANLARAADVVARRLVAAAQREGICGGLEWDGDRAFFGLADGGYLVARARQHAFNRVEVAQRLNVDPAALLLRIAGHTVEAKALAVELTDACVNLALAHERRPSITAPGARDSLDLVAGLDADEACLSLERLATDGHNLHQCGRTRLGWSLPDVLRYDLESPGVDVRFVGVRRDLHVGDDLGGLFAARLIARWPCVHGWRYSTSAAPPPISSPTAPVLLTTTSPPGRPRRCGRCCSMPADIWALTSRSRRPGASPWRRPATQPLSRLLHRLLGESRGPARVLFMTSRRLGGIAAQPPGSDQPPVSGAASPGGSGQ